MQFHALTGMWNYGTELGCYIADEGYVIVETDMSQAEARVVALLGNDCELLELFASKADIHYIGCYHFWCASWCYHSRT
jgi:hypothetical protein